MTEKQKFALDFVQRKYEEIRDTEDFRDKDQVLGSYQAFIEILLEAFEKRKGEEIIWRI